MDIQLLILLLPASIVLRLHQLCDEHIFVIIYAAVANYFAGMMVRLMLTLTLAVCVAAEIPVFTSLDTYVDPIEPDVVEHGAKTEGFAVGATKGQTSGTSTVIAAASATQTPSSKKARKADQFSSTLGVTPVSSHTPSVSATPAKTISNSSRGIYGLDTRITVIFNTLFLLAFFVLHSTYVTSSPYSSPSVVLASTNPDGSQHIIDFTEGYYWLRQNTKEDAG